MIYRHRLRSVSHTLLVSIVAAMVLACPALAIGEHPYLPPPLSKLNEWEPNQVCGAATDSYGDIYVAFLFQGKVKIYGPSGASLAEFSTPKASPCSLAVDPSGDVYAVSPQARVVKYVPSEFPPTEGTIYSPDESVVKGNGVIDSNHPVSVAINPSTRNVYVADMFETEGLHPEHLGRIIEYEPDGKPINETIGAGVLGAKYSDIDVYGANGDVYAVDEAHNEVYIFNATGTEVLTRIDGKNVPDFPGGFGDLKEAHLAVDQSDGDVYVDNVATNGVVDQFKVDPPSGTYVSKLGPTFGPGGSLHLEDHGGGRADIAVDDGSFSSSNGNIYVISQSSEGTAESLYAFGPLTLTVSNALTVAEKGNGAGTVASEPAGIRCAPTCSHEFEEGTKITLTATPAPGSEFTGWKGCEAEPAADECAVTMSEAESVTATFSIIQHTLTVMKSSEGSRSWRGIVTSAPVGIQCGAVCSRTYNQNAKVTLTASVAAGSVFRGWSGGGCSGTSTCQVTLGSDVTVIAIFSAVPATIPTILSILEHPLTVFNHGASVLSAPGSVTVSGSAAPLELACSDGGSACSGKLRLTARIEQGKRTVGMIIGQASCSIAAGGSRTITIKLNGAAEKLLRSGRTLTATLTGPAGLNHTVRLKPGTAQKHHR